MNIYLVIAKVWHEQAVVGVFTSKEAAEKAMMQIREGHHAFDTFVIDEWRDGEIR